MFCNICFVGNCVHLTYHSINGKPERVVVVIEPYMYAEMYQPVYKSCEDYSLFIDGHVESLTFNRCRDV